MLRLESIYRSAIWVSEHKNNAILADLLSKVAVATGDALRVLGL
jgi:hypothetical protein